MIAFVAGSFAVTPLYAQTPGAVPNMVPMYGAFPAQPYGFGGQQQFNQPAQPQKPKPKPIVKYKGSHADLMSDEATDPAPASRDVLENIPREKEEEKAATLPFEIRKSAIKDAAISYGARGGLSWRTYQIRSELEARADYLDKVYNFRQMLVPAPSGLLIEPPIVDEALNAMLISGNGQKAAVADSIYNIVNNAKIVSTARTWRTYLEREWGVVEEPPNILRPENAQEREYWIEMVRKGWDEGVEQANEIFQEDLNQLMADFNGMVRYRMLLAQGMISPPYALQVDRGVTGDGNLMRVGDRAVQITGVPELITGAEEWQPASR